VLPGGGKGNPICLAKTLSVGCACVMAWVLPLAGTIVWPGEDPNGVWRSGQESLPDAEGKTISSYTVVDQFLAILNRSEVRVWSPIRGQP
jgi:hypothetical protein